MRSLSRAHPRVCGENLRAASSASSTPGSSPRVRGKRCGCKFARPRAWLIPACAGKTGHPSGQIGDAEAHPRVCGENHTRTRFTGDVKGSSPRVRGKQVQGARELRRQRLIPACAGKTSTRFQQRHPMQAHPRVCGENPFGYSHARITRGSSPRVRGKPFYQDFDKNGLGLIPACAGKTESLSWQHRQPRAHPRVCGENVKSIPSIKSMTGSSPRVRGKRFIGSSPVPPAGLIPACAGKTERRAPYLRESSAHPRVCGENAQ